MSKLADNLPIVSVLGDLAETLARTNNAVLVAPPGAGKTTRVPLELLQAPWRADGKVLILEPRRLAARNAANRMATLLHEPLGKTVGIRARLSTVVSKETRIEVVTEGVFTRLILDDPGLDGISAVIFDEFHERSLDADLGLALLLDCQKGLRPDLRILIMSATLEDTRVSELLGNAPVIKSEGRSFPIETHYVGRAQNTPVEEKVAQTIARALNKNDGSILVFLPGQREIRRVNDHLSELISDSTIQIAPLHGAMERSAQDQAIQPAPANTRKVVLATAIAETSLTIEGIRCVIDCGLSRVPRYEPNVGATRLTTVRVSRASADQRRGRAGRTEPGICYRLWDEAETISLIPFNDPEIRSADLTALVLDCIEWGVTDPTKLAWLDPPSISALNAAFSELEALEAIDADKRLTSVGRQIRALPLPPRLARMVLSAARSEQTQLAAEIALLLTERGLGGHSCSLEARLDTFRRDQSRRAKDTRNLSRNWATAARNLASQTSGQNDLSVAELLSLAYPDRIAKSRGAPGHFVLANGRGAKLDPTDALAREPFLVVAEMQGTAANTRILSAAPLSEDGVMLMASHRIREGSEISFDEQAGALRARYVRRLDAIELSSKPETLTPSTDTQHALAAAVVARGMAKLPWTKAQRQLRKRVEFLRNSDASLALPDLTDAALAHEPEKWLAPFLAGKLQLQDITADDLGQALGTLLSWPHEQVLQAQAPTHFEAPTGAQHAIDYESPSAPALHIRVQELFGLTEHPAIASGKLPLTLHLLSPAQRPIQITNDLPGFWRGSWASVKAEMKGRYPKHFWPDDPAQAQPTTRAKRRVK